MQRNRTGSGHARQLLVGLCLLCLLGVVMHGLRSDRPPAETIAADAGGYLTATGRPVTLAGYRGRYLWVDHAAAWCSYCAPQTRTIKAVAQRYRGRLDFVTVVVGTHEVMQPPTAATAGAWAARFGLDPERVLARFSTDTLPYHVLYSPQGEVLYRGSGLYDAARIDGIIDAHTRLRTD